ncbi:aminoglycoside phosphotransferase family protein [Neptunicoccus cionae]|uniref:aminoglycoside phosphotransferase family protein n=1 Tax=Neptunicoccus cionae TaxID=2035344 RepID=UPI000C77FA3C|nr:phosphotransferase [Amylibacter cionae]PLS22826.1 aminoglycoside phosphotransferase [Amylibacter cionae]
MTDRSELITQFLKSAEWDHATRANLAGDASNRSYDRLTDPMHGAAVLMNAPPERGEDIRPFVKMTNWLLDQGISAPRILAADEEAGFLLLEDFGDDLFARLCGTARADEVELYTAAVDVLVHLAKAPPPADIAPYNSATYLREAQLLTDWYLPAATGQDTSPELRAEFDSLITAACDGLAQNAVVLRDYHSENLLWLPDREGIRRVGQLDYQDALLGHPAYDLVSLLEDARRDTSPDLQTAMFDHYVTQSGVDKAHFSLAYNTLGMQRNIKIIGIFARLCLRDGKPVYLKHMPRVWDHLQRDLRDPALSALADWLARHVPAPTDDVQKRIAGAGR